MILAAGCYEIIWYGSRVGPLPPSSWNSYARLSSNLFWASGGVSSKHVIERQKTSASWQCTSYSPPTEKLHESPDIRHRRARIGLSDRMPVPRVRKSRPRTDLCSWLRLSQGDDSVWCAISRLSKWLEAWRRCRSPRSAYPDSEMPQLRGRITPLRKDSVAQPCELSGSVAEWNMAFQWNSLAYSRTCFPAF